MCILVRQSLNIVDVKTEPKKGWQTHLASYIAEVSTTGSYIHPLHNCQGTMCSAPFTNCQLYKPINSAFVDRWTRIVVSPSIATVIKDSCHTMGGRRKEVVSATHSSLSHGPLMSREDPTLDAGHEPITGRQFPRWQPSLEGSAASH